MAAESSKKRKVDTKDPQPTETDSDRPVESDEYYDSDGDLEMVSSDNVLFKVHSFYLQAASSVFRGMVASATSSRLELCDTEIETALTITDLLDVIIHDLGDWMHEPESSGMTEVQRGSNLIALATKYDCAKALSQMARHLTCQLSVTDTSSTYAEPYVFMFAAMLGNTDLCSTALTACRGFFWDTDDGPKVDLRCLKNGRLADPSTLSLEIFEAIPTKHLWAWIRAYRNIVQVDLQPVDEEDEPGRHEDLAEEFRRLMGVIKAKKTKQRPAAK